MNGRRKTGVSFRRNGLAFMAAIAAAAPSATLAAEPVHETPSTMVGAFHSAFGQHHARAVHAKGVILEGTFMPAPEARTLTDASLFSGGAVPVIVRFSDFTGFPDIPDTAPDANPRGFAIKLTMKNGAENDIVTHSFNGFPVSNADEFAAFLRAIGASGPDVSRPTPIERFLDTHPLAKRFVTTQKPLPVSYATAAYFGVNAFAVADAAKHRSFVRFRFVPLEGERYLDAATIATRGPDYLTDEIVSRVAKAPARFEWLAQVADSGDPIEDPSIAWPEGRRLVRLGTITIDRAVANQADADKRLLFLPGRLSTGIETADPMLNMRHAAYPISFTERQ